MIKAMCKYPHYVLAPLFYFAVAQTGSSFTMQGVSTWYPTLMKPTYTPPGVIIGVVWTVIYILTAVSVIVFINAAKNKKDLWVILGLYILNGLLNALWSYLFFVKHLLFAAFLDALFIWVTVGLLMISTWSHSRIASMLLVPYFLWASFAAYLTFVIYGLN